METPSLMAKKFQQAILVKSVIAQKGKSCALKRLVIYLRIAFHYPLERESAVDMNVKKVSGFNL